VCELDKGFTTYGIRGRGFFGMIDNPKSRVTKHEKTCSNNQHTLITFTFNTFGFLTPKVVDILHRVQNVMHINVMSLRFMNVVFKRIGFAIEKGLAAHCCLLVFYSWIINC